MLIRVIKNRKLGHLDACVLNNLHTVIYGSFPALKYPRLENKRVGKTEKKKKGCERIYDHLSHKQGVMATY